ncbi:MAG: dihydrofolate reductase [Alphaproteobacteria bacterium]|nr:dihydrofolate reductase [Alphaproteobacteria bacterium]
MEIVIMVAVADNGVIGANGALPWYLPSDLQRFKAITTGRPVVMGRKTFASLCRPLAGRTNIVLTRDAGFRSPGAVVAGSVTEARDIALGDALRRGVGEIMVIGGGEIFRAFVDLADRCEVTEVHAAPAGDAFFALDKADWVEVARERHAAVGYDTADFSFVTFHRRNEQCS